MTFDEVDEQLTLPRYNDLVKFWLKHPPAAILIAHYVGYKSPEPVTAKEGDPDEMDDESMSALAQVFGLPVRLRGNNDERSSS